MFEERTVCATSSSPAEAPGLFPRSPVLERAEPPATPRGLCWGAKILIIGERRLEDIWELRLRFGYGAGGQRA